MILSPMPTGNGAWVLHKQIEREIDGYRVVDYSPWWTLAPPTLRYFSSGPRPDLIHTTVDYGCWSHRTGVPLVVTAHNFVLDSFMQGYASSLQRLHYATDLRWSTQRSLAMADRVTAVSGWLADQLREHLDFQGQIEVIHNGVDTARFTPRVAARVSGPVRVLFCGNLSRRKRADLIVPLAKALGADFELCYTGGLNSQATLHGADNLRPLGTIPPLEMPGIYQQVDLLFMPSIREGFGLCVAEAMAAGLPIVAYLGSAIPELVVDGMGGALSEDGSLESYVEAIRALATDSGRLADIGQFNRDRASRKFSIDQMIAQYQVLFSGV